jgi:16S rRNA (guanine527-N7)-methyltransferase
MNALEPTELTPEQVLAIIAALPGVDPAGLALLPRFAELLTIASGEQNLVSASTLGDRLWTRHLLDSAQLLRHAPPPAPGGWIDVGSGPGLPGLVIALLAPAWSVTLVESRRLRCDFLRHCIAELALDPERVQVIEGKVERIAQRRFAVISARAFAPLDRLIDQCRHLSDQNSIWLLPKGRNAVNELSDLPPRWQTMFHVEPSQTDADAAILVGRGNFKA